jgi:prepilin-type N-terminal cleavage/methylation domain-containing protein/prepilin-type processing-associated H-X9-DG protein
MSGSSSKSKLQEGIRPRDSGFTLVELLVVMAIIGILAGLILPVLSQSKAKARGLFCQNNNRQLMAGWLMYADDHAQKLAYNLAGAAARSKVNWVAGVLNWELSNDNTNVTDLTEAALGSYVAKVSTIYRCPSDSVVSPLQRAAGWPCRTRSYSMNASVGDAGELSSSGVNTNNPGYMQFFKLTSIPAPARIFVFLDEHPDSIKDGYFVNRSYYPEWIRLPASWHNGGAAFSFADGHSETYLWKCASTKPSSQPDAAGLPIDVSDDPRDFNWVIAHMSVPLGPLRPTNPDSGPPYGPPPPGY